MIARQTVPLGSVVYINPNLGVVDFEADELVDFVPMAAVEANASVTASLEARPYEEVKKGYTYFADGDILLAKITPCFENGKISQIRIRSAAGFGSTEFHVIRPQSDKLDARYLVHLLRQERIRTEGERRMTGSAGQRRVPKSFLESLPVFLPSLSEQRRIATILDKADALRTKRREALAQLDRLAQSIFVEMFGDPVTNPKGWPITQLDEHLLDVTNGLTRRGNEVDAGEQIVLRLRDIRAGSIDFSEPNRITLNEREKAKYRVVSGELLFIRVNGNPEYVGRCSVFDGHSEPVFFNDHVMRVRLKEGLDGGYLGFFLNRQEGKREIAKHRKTSAGQHTINQDGLAAISLPLPPTKLQQQFLHRLTAVRKSVALHSSALSELDLFFRAAQHCAFQGDL